MRSSIGPLLVLFGLATTVVLVLLLFQNLGLRSDLEAARAEVAELRTAVEDSEPGVTTLELDRRLDALETQIRDWLLTAGAGGGSPGTDGGPGESLVDRLDEILAGIQALDARVDQICDSVPVC